LFLKKHIEQKVNHKRPKKTISKNEPKSYLLTLISLPVTKAFLAESKAKEVQIGQDPEENSSQVFLEK
jgi:hypothetical protein